MAHHTSLQLLKGWLLAGLLALSAGVSQLALFHHDPRRTDREILDLERRCRGLFPNATAAREGMALKLDGAGGGARPVRSDGVADAA